jgi:hypothetical protein
MCSSGPGAVKDTTSTAGGGNWTVLVVRLSTNAPAIECRGLEVATHEMWERIIGAFDAVVWKMSFSSHS